MMSCLEKYFGDQDIHVTIYRDKLVVVKLDGPSSPINLTKWKVMGPKCIMF